jgi:hypothetical protein
MRPAVGCSNPATSRRVVVLPQPEGPKGEELAPGHVQVDAVDGGDVLEPLLQPDQPDLASAHPATPFSHAPPKAS